MRIAIVCANYVEGKSYQENVWAEQLAKNGHAVRVFHAGRVNGPVKRVTGAVASHESQEALARKLPKYTYVSTSVRGVVRKFQPDLIVVCGDKTFAYGVARDAEMVNVPLISTYSENLSMHEFDWRKKGISLRQRSLAIGFILYRGWTTRLMCRRSAVIVGNTPQARPILARLFNKKEWTAINEKMIDMPLGFSPEHFGYDEQKRRRVRAELGVTDRDIVLIATSHFAPVKEQFLRLIINAIQSVGMAHSSVKGLIVGFSEQPDHAAVSERVRRQIEASPIVDRFIEHPFAQRERLCELYNAADIAIFGRASISCQEALGTGLIGCFVDGGSLNHLITMQGQGVFFRSNDEHDLAEKLGQAVRNLEKMDHLQRDAFRKSLADGSRWLGFDRIIDATLAHLPGQATPS